MVNEAAKPTSIAADISFWRANNMARMRSGTAGAQDKMDDAVNAFVQPNDFMAFGIDSATFSMMAANSARDAMNTRTHTFLDQMLSSLD